ncbi:glycosyltransferase [Lacticaseibacillus paracasei]|uniref:glycosyltransferase n=1 Tax=Lacticaseibacillus paracasei TaxID=1597 RepID=UPI0025A208CF|nr:glycosyltransferase [Lacticaseibacillus paracasei]MDM7542662.1 glycosyltransferase [Lacticaseibacillus paracasei]
MEISYSVVLYHNSLQQVRKLVENVIATVPQNLDFKLYLINNSPDDTALSEALMNLSTQNSNIIPIFPESNRGFGAGHNLGIQRITSAYHTIVNPDIIIPDSSQVEKIVEYMQESASVLVQPEIRGANGELQRLVKLQPTVLDMALRFLGPKMFKTRQHRFVHYDDYEHIIHSSNLSGSFLVFRSDILKKIGGFDERYFLYMEDADIGRMMNQYGPTVYFPGARVVHEWQRNNKKSFRGILQMLSSMTKYFRKWGWKFW